MINESTSASPSSKLSAPDTSDKDQTNDFQSQVKESFASELFKLPLANWLRNSGSLDDPARFTSKTTLTGDILESTMYFAHGTRKTHRLEKKQPYNNSPLTPLTPRERKTTTRRTTHSTSPPPDGRVLLRLPKLRILPSHQQRPVNTPLRPRHHFLDNDINIIPKSDTTRIHQAALVQVCFRDKKWPQRRQTNT